MVTNRVFLIGEVIFDRTHPGFPPDIVFSSEDDIIEFEPNIDQLEVYTYSFHSPCHNVIPSSTHLCAVYYAYIIM